MDLIPTGYVCSMHPGVRRLGPGTCPRCGLQLVPQEPRLAVFRALAGHPLPIAALLVLLLIALAVGAKLLW